MTNAEYVAKRDSLIPRAETIARIAANAKVPEGSRTLEYAKWCAEWNRAFHEAMNDQWKQYAAREEERVREEVAHEFSNHAVQGISETLLEAPGDELDNDRRTPDDASPGAIALQDGPGEAGSVPDVQTSSDVGDGNDGGDQ